MFTYAFLLQKQIISFIKGSKIFPASSAPDKKRLLGWFRDNLTYFSVKTYFVTNHSRGDGSKEGS